MGMYKKKPVVIEAHQFRKGTYESAKLYNWIEMHVGSVRPLMDYEPTETIPNQGVSIDPETGQLEIFTLEGVMRAQLGDWVIRGVQGEFYPCKPDIFEETYDWWSEY